MDNNQKGERMKYQREDKSSSFTLVTCMIAVQPQINSRHADLIDDMSSTQYTSHHPIISYTNQAIPSPYGMLSYKSLVP